MADAIGPRQLCSGDFENVDGQSIMNRGWPARPQRARRRPSENVPEAGNSLTIHPDSLAEPEDYRQIYELRLVLEAGAAEVAARNATPDDLEAIRRCIDAMANVTELHGAYVETDISFHRAVATATRNAFVSLFINFVDVKLKESILLALKHLDFQSTKAISVREHEDIFNAIRMRDATAAASAMRKHLQNSSRRLGLIPKL
jgi:DNA-binding FadR family transcriptional regulator